MMLHRESTGVSGGTEVSSGSGESSGGAWDTGWGIELSTGVSTGGRDRVGSTGDAGGSTGDTGGSGSCVGPVPGASGEAWGIGDIWDIGSTGPVQVCTWGDKFTERSLFWTLVHTCTICCC